jgi:hypothetical protein
MWKELSVAKWVINPGFLWNDRKITRSRSSRRDLNVGPSEYEILPTRSLSPMPKQEPVDYEAFHRGIFPAVLVSSPECQGSRPVHLAQRLRSLCPGGERAVDTVGLLARPWPASRTPTNRLSMLKSLCSLVLPCSSPSFVSPNSRFKSSHHSPQTLHKLIRRWRFKSP